jgi:hypothetical protein
VRALGAALRSVREPLRAVRRSGTHHDVNGWTCACSRSGRRARTTRRCHRTGTWSRRSPRDRVTQSPALRSSLVRRGHVRCECQRS